MKTKEELNALKEEVETLNKKLAELSEDELAEVTGGWCYRDIEISLSEYEISLPEYKKERTD